MFVFFFTHHTSFPVFCQLVAGIKFKTLKFLNLKSSLDKIKVHIKTVEKKTELLFIFISISSSSSSEKDAGSVCAVLCI